MREPIVNIAVSAARIAGNIILKALDRLDSLVVSEKKSNDFVTEIDQQVEREIIQVIRKSHPNHGILGEESGETPGNDFTWIIDPIDGTRNFVHGYPHFAISIGIRFKNKIEHGVIYDPIRQELFSATRGKGARLNEHRIRVSKRIQLEQCLLGTTDYQSTYYPHYAQAVSELMATTELRYSGSAALDLAYVAAGRLDGFFGLNLKLWDLAAGVLFVKEAGGMTVDIEGGESYLQTGDIIAGNPKVLKNLLKILRKPHS